MFEKTKEALYRFHILSSTYSTSVAEHGDNCNLQTAAHGELDNALKLVEGQKPTTNSKSMPCLCETGTVPAICRNPDGSTISTAYTLYVNKDCGIHGHLWQA